MKTRFRAAPALRHPVVNGMLLLLALLAAPVASAQGPGRMGDPRARMQQRVEMLTTRLKLTPEQVEKLKPILAKQMADQQALFQAASGDFQSLRPGMQALREGMERAVETLLREEQKADLRALLEEEAERRARGPRGPGDL